MITFLGLASGAMTTASMLPQINRAIRSGSTNDLSWSWLMLFAIGVIGWITYGLLTSDLAITISNLVTVGLVGVLVTVKARHTGLRTTISWPFILRRY